MPGDSYVSLTLASVEPLGVRVRVCASFSIGDPKFMVDGRILSKTGAWVGNRGKTTAQAKEEYVTMVAQLQVKYHVVFPPTRAPSVDSVATTFTSLPYY